MPRHLLRAVFLLALFAGTLGVAAPALAVDTPFGRPLRADAARQHQRRRQPAADLPRRRYGLHRRAQPGGDLDDAQQQLRHGLRRRRRRRVHPRLLRRRRVALPGGATVTLGLASTGARDTSAGGWRAQRLAAAPASNARLDAPRPPRAATRTVTGCARTTILASLAWPGRYQRVRRRHRAGGRRRRRRLHASANVQAGTGRRTASAAGRWSWPTATAGEAGPQPQRVSTASCTVDAHARPSTTTIDAGSTRPAAGARGNASLGAASPSRATPASRVTATRSTARRLRDAINGTNNFYELDSIGPTGARASARRTPNYVDQLGYGLGPSCPWTA